MSALPSHLQPGEAVLKPVVSSKLKLRTSRRRLDASELLLSLVVGLVLTALVLPPVVSLVMQSLTVRSAGGERLSLQNYVDILTNAKLAATIPNTFIFALGAMVISLLVGSVVAWLVERTNSPFKLLAYLTTIVSMGSPYILYVSAWLFLLGRSGPINDMSRSFVGVNLINVHSLPGMMFVEGFLWSPLVFLMMTAVFRNGNAEMEEAARVSGASIFFTVWHISIRMARPAVLALAIFVFVRNVEAFEVPALIGMPGRIEVLTTQIYDTIKQVPPNLGQASAFSVLLLLIVAVVLLYYGRISAKAEQYASVTGKGYRSRRLDLKSMRPVGGAIIVINFVILLGLPLLAIVWTALMPFNLPMRWSNMHFATWQNFTTVLHSKHNLEMAVNTLIVAASAATAVMIISMLAGWIAARRKPAGRIIDQLAAVPLMFPGIVLGVAILQTALRLPGAIYGTVALIAIGYTIRYMPYGMRYCYAGVLQIHKDLEDVAAVSGASLGRKLCRIVAPLLAPSLVAGWLFIFLIASKELSMAILLAGPNSQMMAVVLFDQWSNGEAGELSAIGLIWTALMTVVAIALHLCMNRSPSGVYGLK